MGGGEACEMITVSSVASCHIKDLSTSQGLAGKAPPMSLTRSWFVCHVFKDQNRRPVSDPLLHFTVSQLTCKFCSLSLCCILSLLKFISHCFY